MFTVRPGVAAVGVFVATVSVLGLCFKVWPGDYQLIFESKSAKISQPHKSQPAMHLQLDENEKASMRKTVLDLHGAVVKFNALLENVTPPTSEILFTENEKAATCPACPTTCNLIGCPCRNGDGDSTGPSDCQLACQCTDGCTSACPSTVAPTGAPTVARLPYGADNTYTLSGTGCAPENAIKTVEECKTAATALGKKWWKSIDSKHNAPGCHVDYESVGFNTNPGRKASCMSGETGEKGPICICRGTAATATGGKKLDKAHRICLNTRLNELDDTYETSLVDYKAKKGEDFVEGPVTQWSTAYANADEDQSLADEDFLKVAAAKANFDGLFFYLKTSHAIEICDFTAEDANKEAVKANPVLFNLPESKCAKAISAVADFETGAGEDLLSKCNSVVTEAPTDRGAE